MPGCLIELGFISTRDEEQYMNSALATEQYARGIYNAFIAYKKRFAVGSNDVFIAESKEENVRIPQVVPERVKEKTLPKSEPKSEPLTKQDVQDVPETPKTPEISDTQEIPDSSASSVVPEAEPKVEVPVFKVQILGSSKKLASSDSRLKGLKDVGYYQENGLYKYTVGSSENYNEIYRLRKEVLDKFPEAFIIAFKNGVKMNVQEAIREFKNNKSK